MKRLFDDNHEWTPEAIALDKHMKSAIQQWVLSNPGCDPRDVQLVASESIADAIRWIIVRERLQKQKPETPMDPDDDGDE
mgnify:CR=1 FL=1